MTALSSMQYTIGTALERAREAGTMVELLVESHWLTGLVVASDGIGVVLDNHGEEHCVVRLECVSAVRVSTEAPMRRRIQRARENVEELFEEPMPMPGPQAAASF